MRDGVPSFMTVSNVSIDLVDATSFSKTESADNKQQQQ